MHALSLWLVLVLTAAPAAPAPAAARTLNTEGFRLYQAGKYPEALEKFQKAAEADPRLALAHYNVAATLGVLRKQGAICEYSAHREVILDRLQRAIRLDPRRLARAKEDQDLEPIHDTLGWQALLGLSLKKPGDLPELLRRVTWSNLTAGDLGARRTLTFPDAGSALLKEVAFDEETSKIVKREERGTYTLEGRTVRLSFPGKAPIQGTLTLKGALKLGALGTYTDLPTECDA